MTHAVFVVIICAVITEALRALPFVCFGGKKGVPRLVAALGETLPPAIMAALVVYCLKSVPFGTMTDGAKQLIARRCGGRAASLEEEYAAQHRRGNGAVYAADPALRKVKDR